MFTNIEQQTQVNGCFHVKCKIDGDQSLFNFNMSCIRKWRIDMKQLMHVLEYDVESTDSCNKYMHNLSEPQILQRISMKKRGKRGKVVSRKFSDRKNEIKKQKKEIKQLHLTNNMLFLMKTNHLLLKLLKKKMMKALK